MHQFTEIVRYCLGKNRIFGEVIGCSGQVPRLPTTKFVFIAQKDPRLWYGFFFARILRQCCCLGTDVCDRLPARGLAVAQPRFRVQVGRVVPHLKLDFGGALAIGGHRADDFAGTHSLAFVHAHRA